MPEKFQEERALILLEIYRSLDDAGKQRMEIATRRLLADQQAQPGRSQSVDQAPNQASSE